MPGNPISVQSLVAVAEARASFAEHRTGRECRPTNARLAELTGLSVRTVQRASTALRLLGVATEVMRGRQRTRAERFASWRVGDRGRGWASVWALHDSRIQPLSPHPEGSQLDIQTSRKSVLTTKHRSNTAGRRAASRRASPDHRALALANKWVLDEQSPPWARRYRTGSPWARILAGPAHHGWTPRDVNQLITDWIGTGHWVPDTPHKPIGLLGRDHRRARKPPRPSRGGRHRPRTGRTGGGPGPRRESACRARGEPAGTRGRPRRSGRARSRGGAQGAGRDHRARQAAAVAEHDDETEPR